MVTYTVFDGNGNARPGLTLSEAGEALLTADGYTYEIAPDADGDGFRLFRSKASSNAAGPRGMRASVFFSLEAERAAAEAEIYARVVAHDSDWHGWQAMEDNQFARWWTASQEDC